VGSISAAQSREKAVPDEDQNPETHPPGLDVEPASAEPAILCRRA
jgi:hypothetical protein